MFRPTPTEACTSETKPIPRTELRQGICNLTIEINVPGPVLESG